MSDGGALSAKVLGQITLMQSVIAQLPCKETMLKFACEGLRDVSGVDHVDYIVRDGLIIASEIFPVYGITRTFYVQRNGFIHAEIRFSLQHEEIFAPYIPFIENFCSMLAVIFEEIRQKTENKLLMESLEKRVSDRTKALKVETEERKRAEEEIRREKERLMVTLCSIGDGVITTDIEGNVMLINRVAEKLTGWKVNDAQGKPLHVVFRIVHELTRKECENPVTKVLSSGQIVELANHTVLIARDGTERVIADSGAPIKNSDGTTIGVVLVFRDMTEKQQLLETIQRTAKLDSLGTLAGGIAHDFNNLLGGIFGYIDIASEACKEENVKHYLFKAMNTIDRARSLTKQLLTFAKGGDPIRRPDSLFPFVQETAQFALCGTSAVCICDRVPELWLSSYDKNQLGQAIHNIVLNAQQAMPEGGIIKIFAENCTIGEKAHPVLPAGDYVKIVIQDSGVGISREVLPRIFDPFFTTKIHGHGLGLATSYSIINRHGGSIDVTSTVGKGSAFTIYLPALNESQQITEEKTEMHQGIGTFIIVDDEAVVREIISEMLRSLGYRVICREKGDDVIALLSSELKGGRPITAMIVDLTIPGGIGGRELLQEIRKICRETPVFVASGYANDPIMANPQKYGFTDSICKPFRKAELINMLDNYFLRGN